MPFDPGVRMIEVISLKVLCCLVLWNSWISSAAAVQNSTEDSLSTALGKFLMKFYTQYKLITYSDSLSLIIHS